MDKEVKNPEEPPKNEQVKNPEETPKNVSRETSQAPDVSEEIKALREQMEGLISENKAMREMLNTKFQQTSEPPPPPADSVDAITYGQLAEQLVNSPDSITSRFVADYERSTTNNAG